MHEKPNSRLAILIYVFVFALVLAACGPTAEPTTTAGDSTTAGVATTAGETTAPESTTAAEESTDTTSGDGRVLIIGTNNDPVSFDPSGAATTLDWSIIGNFNGSLYRMEGANPVPDMAVGPPEVSADGLEVTVTLRDDIMFGDGLALTAPLYVQQFQRTLDFGGLGAEIRVLPFVESVEATDDTTVVFHLTSVNPVFPSWMTNADYSPAHPDIFPADEVLNLPDPPIYGTGPFILTDYDLTEGRIVFEPNPNYYGEQPPWDQVIWRLFSDPQTMALSLENGEIDVIWKTLNDEQLVSLRENPDITVAPFSQGLLYFIVNHAMAPSDDSRVNQAVASVLDRDAVLDRALGGVGHATAYSPIPPDIMGSLEVFSTKFQPPNVEMAESLLAEAGYSQENPVHIVLGYSTSQWGPSYRDVVDLFAAQLSETGLFDVEVQDIEWATYLEGVLAGDTYNYAFLDKSPGSDPAQFTGLFVNGTGVGTWLTDEEDNPLFDEAAEVQDQVLLAQGILDVGEREAAYHELGEMWADVVVTIPLFLKQNELAYRNDRVQGDPAFEGSEGLGIGLNDHFYYDRVIPVE